MQLTIEATGIEELVAKVKALATALGLFEKTTHAVPPQPVVHVPELPAAKRKGRPPGKRNPPGSKTTGIPDSYPDVKITSPMPKESISSSAPQEPTPFKIVSRDEATQALKKVNDIKGINTARAVLSKFNCHKMVDVKEEQYGPLIEECNQVLGGL